MDHTQEHKKNVKFQQRRHFKLAKNHESNKMSPEFMPGIYVSPELRAQFVKDMETAGLSKATQQRYLKNVDLFFKSAWYSPAEVTEAMVQDFIISVRNRDVARERFRGYHYALKCFFVNTVGCDWPLF